MARKRQNKTTKKLGPTSRTSPRPEGGAVTVPVATILGSSPTILLERGLSDALVEVMRLTALKPILPISLADRLLLLAKSVVTRHPKRAMEVCDHILALEKPPVEALLIVGSVQDRLGERQACQATMRSVLASERAQPVERLRAANLLVRFGEQELALNAARAAFEAMGRPLEHAATLLYIAQVTADWPLVDQLTAQLRQGYADGQIDKINESPRTHLLWCDDEALNLKVLDLWSRRNLPDPIMPAPKARPVEGRRLRIGYLSSDFREHPTARLILGVLRHHDRSQVELFMYCSGWNDGSVLRKQIEAQFEHIHSVATLSDEAAADLIRSHDVDVLVELNGPTRAHRMGILRHRPAPVQIDYLGWPGSVGGRVVDFIVADDQTIPDGAEKQYPEKIIRLHPTYQANDHASFSRAPKPSRKDVGLPEDPSVQILGMFNAINKVHQQVWDTWMAILRAAPNAMLWILDPGPVARKAIARAAQSAGVSVSRILASPKLPQAQHLARIQCCDLMLDPWPYGGHTSTADALFAGVPVLAMEGENFASRVSPSLLRIAGLEDLVCGSVPAYVGRAVTLLENQAALTSLRSYLLSTFRDEQRFQAQSMARQLESVFSIAVERAAQGLPAVHITINGQSLAGELQENEVSGELGSSSLSRDPQIDPHPNFDAGALDSDAEKPVLRTDEKTRIPLVLVCGPWSSGTSAVAGLLAKAGLEAPGPYVSVNDPKTPETFEMRAFQRVLKELASEETLELRVTPEVATERLRQFRDEVLKPALGVAHETGTVLLKHGLATLFLKQLSQLFDLRIVGVLRPLEAIESTRKRRGWPASFGSKGASIIYKKLFDHLVNTRSPFHLVRYDEFFSAPEEEFRKIASFCNISPSTLEKEKALAFIERRPINNKKISSNPELRQLSPSEVHFNLLRAIPEVDQDAVTVFSILKNEMYFLPHFLSHYRRMGVRRFLFVDDHSTDGSKEFLLRQPDCGVLQSNYEFKHIVQGKRFGVKVKSIVPQRYLRDRWVLTVDLDEFLILPPSHSDINKFASYLESSGLHHSRALMLDFFPERLSILESASPDTDPFVLCPYFDDFTVVDWPDGDSAPRRLSLDDGVRFRMAKQLQQLQQLAVGNDIWAAGYKAANLNKVPLVKWTSGVEALSPHRMNFSVSDRNQLVLSHFKFFPGWEKKVDHAMSSGAYWNNSVEYRFLNVCASDLVDWVLVGNRSKKFSSIRQLEDLGLVWAARLLDVEGSPDD